jgi:2-phospho-L-lactate guanylyltransferase
MQPRRTQPRPVADLSRTWAVVPIRGLETAKTRLGEGLDSEERLELVTALLRRTLRATRDARSITGTVVVTMDPAAAGLAKAHGAIGLVERAPGLNPAIEAGRSVAVARGATAVLVLPADIPGVSAEALDELADRATGATDGRALVVLVPDQHGAGTNALLVSPPDLIDPSFGAGSRESHAAAARLTGATLFETGGPLSLDVDTPADLLAAEAALGALDG